jgi:hypothetical protein
VGSFENRRLEEEENVWGDVKDFCGLEKGKCKQNLERLSMKLWTLLFGVERAVFGMKIENL